VRRWSPILATQAARRIHHTSIPGSTPCEILACRSGANLLQLRGIDDSALIHGDDVIPQFLFLGLIEPRLIADFDVDFMDQSQLIRMKCPEQV
jgi:hypothetical protein